ncbi:MAG: hypothetical protein HQK62_09190 [Desulfamplus sp.]|nr:hypothetical protein [Desulfamplus sp.]
MAESPGQFKITDLNSVEPKIDVRESFIEVKGRILTPSGYVIKSICIYNNLPMINIEYKFEWDRFQPSSLRLGHITLLPESFDRLTLFYRTSNGGYMPDTFFLNSEKSSPNIHHSAACSFLVSASHAVGITDGIIDIGDADHYIRVNVDKQSAALIGMIVYSKVDDVWFYRLILSAMEMDDTSMQSLYETVGAGLCACPCEGTHKGVPLQFHHSLCPPGYGRYRDHKTGINRQWKFEQKFCFSITGSKGTYNS